jgi:class 3 adenylate cyclase
VRREHFAALRRAVVENGGREVRSTGEGLMVAFSSAVAAVRCAVDMQRATAATRGGLRLSAGLDAGEPLPEGENLYGTPVIIASRLCDAAGPGEILASEVVCRIARPRLTALIEPAGALRLRGISERVAASRIRPREDAGGEPQTAEPPAAPREISVVIADDERLLRTGFRVILDDEPDLKVIGEASAAAGRTSC